MRAQLKWVVGLNTFEILRHERGRNAPGSADRLRTVRRDEGRGQSMGRKSYSRASGGKSHFALQRRNGAAESTLMPSRRITRHKPTSRE